MFKDPTETVNIPCRDEAVDRGDFVRTTLTAGFVMRAMNEIARFGASRGAAQVIDEDIIGDGGLSEEFKVMFLRSVLMGVLSLIKPQQATEAVAEFVANMRETQRALCLQCNERESCDVWAVFSSLEDSEDGETDTIQ